MDISQNKNSSKKVYALYLAVAFFFTVFSFGNISDVDAYTLAPSSISSGGTSTPFAFSGTPPFDVCYWRTTSLSSSGTLTNTSDVSSNPYPSLQWENLYGSYGDMYHVFYTFNDGDGTYPTDCADGTRISYAETNAVQRVIFRRQGGVWTSDFDTTSYVTVTQPTAITYVGNPVTFSGFYSNVHTFDKIQFELSNSNFAGTIYFPDYQLPYTSCQNCSWTLSRNLAFLGNYSFRARLKDTTTGSTTPWTNAVSFSLGTTTIATSTSDTLPGAPLPIDCDALDMACHIKNAMVWLFYPSTESVENFQTLSSALENKAPFVYLYQIDDLRQEMFGASTSPQTISLNFKIIPGHGTSTLELLSKSKLEAVPFASTVKTILGYILLFLGAEYIYYRVIRSHDSNTPA